MAQRGTRITVKTNERGFRWCKVNGRHIEIVRDDFKVERVSDAEWKIATHWTTATLVGGFHAGGTSRDWFLRLEGDGVHTKTVELSVSSAAEAIRTLVNA